MKICLRPTEREVELFSFVALGYVVFFLYFSHQPRLLLLFGDGKEGVTPTEIEKNLLSSK